MSRNELNIDYIILWGLTVFIFVLVSILVYGKELVWGEWECVENKTAVKQECYQYGHSYLCSKSFETVCAKEVYIKKIENSDDNIDAPWIYEGGLGITVKLLENYTQFQKNISYDCVCILQGKVQRKEIYVEAPIIDNECIFEYRDIFPKRPGEEIGKDDYLITTYFCN